MVVVCAEPKWCSMRWSNKHRPQCCVRALLVLFSFFFSFLFNVVTDTCTFVQTGLQLSNNKIKDVGELGKLAGLPNLRDILLIGNPCYEGMEKAEQRAAVLAQLPNIAKIDGEMVTAADREGGGETKE